MHARRPANPDGNVDYTLVGIIEERKQMLEGPKAAEDAYERAKQAEQDALAAQTALAETSLQAQIDMEAIKKAREDLEIAAAAAKKFEQDSLAASLQAATELKAVEDAYERAKQAEQDALAAQTTLVKISLQAQIDMEAIKKANKKMQIAAEALMRKEEDIKQQKQATALAAMKAKEDLLAANIALQTAKELRFQLALTSEAYVTSLQVPPKKQMKRKGAMDEDGEDFIGWVEDSI